MSTALDDLAHSLRSQYERAPEGRKVASLHLFGIEHRQALAGVSKHDLAQRAGLPRSYGTELSKGAVLGAYVRIDRPLLQD